MQLLFTDFFGRIKLHAFEVFNALLVIAIFV